MAGIDQDNFSNISWHSEQNSGREPSSAAVNDATSPDFSTSRQDAGLDRDENTHHHHHGLELGHGEELLECIVSEPHKENDGTKDAYVSYLITTNVGSSSMPSPFFPGCLESQTANGLEEAS